jgi:hypothetical protein
MTGLRASRVRSLPVLLVQYVHPSVTCREAHCDYLQRGSRRLLSPWLLLSECDWTRKGMQEKEQSTGRRETKDVYVGG